MDRVYIFKEMSPLLLSSHGSNLPKYNKQGINYHVITPNCPPGIIHTQNSPPPSCLDDENDDADDEKDILVIMMIMMRLTMVVMIFKCFEASSALRVFQDQSFDSAAS